MTFDEGHVNGETAGTYGNKMRLGGLLAFLCRHHLENTQPRVLIPETIYILHQRQARY